MTISFDGNDNSKDYKKMVHKFGELFEQKSIPEVSTSPSKSKLSSESQVKVTANDDDSGGDDLLSLMDSMQ
jgi:hypothetical protein